MMFIVVVVIHVIVDVHGVKFFRMSIHSPYRVSPLRLHQVFPTSLSLSLSLSVSVYYTALIAKDWKT